VGGVQTADAPYAAGTGGGDVGAGSGGGGGGMQPERSWSTSVHPPGCVWSGGGGATSTTGGGFFGRCGRRPCGFAAERIRRQTRAWARGDGA
jgi:hypothetical protein